MITLLSILISAGQPIVPEGSPVPIYVPWATAQPVAIDLNTKAPRLRLYMHRMQVYLFAAETGCQPIRYRILTAAQQVALRKFNPSLSIGTYDAVVELRISSTALVEGRFKGVIVKGKDSGLSPSVLTYFGVDVNFSEYINGDDPLEPRQYLEGGETDPRKILSQPKIQPKNYHPYERSIHEMMYDFPLRTNLNKREYMAAYGIDRIPNYCKICNSSIDRIPSCGKFCHNSQSLFELEIRNHYKTIDETNDQFDRAINQDGTGFSYEQERIPRWKWLGDLLKAICKRGDEDE